MKTLLKEMKKGIFPANLIRSIQIDYDGEREYRFRGDALDLICEPQAYRIACNLVRNARAHQSHTELSFYAGYSATKMTIELETASA